MFFKMYMRHFKATVRNCLRKQEYLVYTGQEFTYFVTKYKKGTKEHIKTNLPQQISFAQRTRNIEYAMKKCLETGKYTENRILVIQNPYHISPLSAMLLFKAKNKCSVHVYLDDKKIYDHWTEEKEEHVIPVYGLLAGCSNKVHLEIWREGKREKEKQIFLVTAELLPEIKDAVKVDKKKKDSALPLTLVFGGNTVYPYAFDEKGEVRYFLRKQTRSYGLYPLSRGRFLLLADKILEPSLANPHSVLCYEMDFLGRVHREYVVMDGIHHDGCEKEPKGNLIMVSSSHDKYVEDTVIEVERETGKVVDKMVLGDVMTKHPYFDWYDWAHINTVSYDPEENTILICARNLHSVIKLDWQTKEILWIFADTEVWKGTPYEEKVLKADADASYCYQAHAAYFLEEKTKEGKRQMILYDNHWHARRPIATFDGDVKSYVKIYEIDEKEKTILLQKRYGTKKSKIRSNGVVVGDRVFSMSGCLLKPLKGSMKGVEGLIGEFDKKSGKLINRYLTKHSFYRAYPFFADFKAMSEYVREENSDIIGEYPMSYPCDEQIFEEANVFDQEENENVKKIVAKFYADNLLLYGKDHLIQKVYYRGKKNCYMQDHSGAKQMNEDLFGDFYYAVLNQTKNIEPDDYQVYIQADGKIYDMKINFTKTS